MALPIAPTPTLSAKESRDFLKKIEEGLKNPVGPRRTPRINEAIKKIREAHGFSGTK